MFDVVFATRESHLIRCASPEFEAYTGVRYCTQLKFADAHIRARIKKKCHLAARLDPRQKWLGSYYSKELRSDFSIDCTIKWIDPLVGYGVFTNQPIPKHAYVGEYVGVVKRRPFFGRLKNHYCFDYTLALGRRTPYIIDAQKEGNYTRYINHSYHPNLETASVLCEGMMHIIVYAIEDIPKGSQLFYDYGPNYWANRKAPIIIPSR